MSWVNEGTEAIKAVTPLFDKIILHNRCIKIIGQYLEREKEHFRPGYTAMRNIDELKTADGKTLFDLVRKGKSSVIVITGEKDVGKKQTIECVIHEFLTSIDSKKLGAYLSKSVAIKIPVYISDTDYRSYEKENGGGEEVVITDLIYHVMCKSSKEEQVPPEKLKSVISKIAAHGNFLPVFEKSYKALQMINKSANPPNVILTAFDFSSGGEFFATKRERREIPLAFLSKTEIFNYLSKIQFHNARMIRDMIDTNENVYGILKRPKCLRLFEELQNFNETGFSDIVTEAEFIDFYLSSAIESVVQNRNIDFIKKRKQYYFGSLSQYAISSFYHEDTDPQLYMKSINKLKWTDFQDAKIIDENNKFKYDTYRWFFIAYGICTDKNQCNLETISRFCNSPQEQVLIYAAEILAANGGGTHSFDDFWEILLELYNKHLPHDGNGCNILLLARILKNVFNLCGERCFTSFCRLTFEGLKKDFYDYSVFEAYSEMKDRVISFIKEKYCNPTCGTEKELYNLKRRIVYYQGLSENGITTEMIDDFLDGNSEEHLKYHVIRAMCECCRSHRETALLIQKRYAEIEAWCRESESPIIKSDFDVLNKMIDRRSGTACHEQTLQALKATLNDPVYWKRAHAAGALGRRGDPGELSHLTAQLRTELNGITEDKRNEKNIEEIKKRVKVISYIVESICELTKDDADKCELIKELLGVINISQIGYEPIEDAYVTIATGIEYLNDVSPNKPRFNLGGRFRNRHNNYYDILEKIFNSFGADYYDKMLVDMAEASSNKLKEFRQKKANEDIISKGVDCTDKRFKIALSFPGEYRQQIKQIVDMLISNHGVGQDEILYDEFFKAEFARPNLDSYLQKLYHNESELLVVGLCEAYEKKLWCGLEWRAIRDLLNKHAENIMFLKFDAGDVSGVFSSVDGYVDMTRESVKETAALIYDRHRGLRPPVHGGENTVTA